MIAERRGGRLQALRVCRHRGRDRSLSESGLDASLPVMRMLPLFGPTGSAPPVSVDAAVEYTRSLATGHYENFSVLSRLVPESLRDDFAAVYAFCRWSDDLADETGTGDLARARSSVLLRWWRDELHSCFLGHAEHPVFVALRETIGRHNLSRQPFDDLIDAFAQDQTVTRYRTWDELLEYCRRSANPVGRLVLALGGYRDEPANAELYRMSDATCTALQLINFWQDVRRDLLDRDRVYLPSEEVGFGIEELRSWVDRPNDARARVRFIRALRPLVEKTSALFDEGRPLPSRLDPSIRPVVWLFGAGGRAILRKVDVMGCATLWHRPRLRAPEKAILVARAWWMWRVADAARRGGEGERVVQDGNQ